MEQLVNNSTVVQAGAVGIALVALVALVMIVRLFVKEMRKQSAEHAEAMQTHADAMAGTIDRNTAALTENAKATAALTASLPHVCQYGRPKS